MSANIGLSLSATKLEIAPGESVEATITVRNQSQIVDQLDLRVDAGGEQVEARASQCRTWATFMLI
jgi:uncharacterized membrane protein